MHISLVAALWPCTNVLLVGLWYVHEYVIDVPAWSVTGGSYGKERGCGSLQLVVE
jgi:hypothetical protein